MVLERIYGWLAGGVCVVCVCGVGGSGVEEREGGGEEERRHIIIYMYTTLLCAVPSKMNEKCERI